MHRATGPPRGSQRAEHPLCRQQVAEGQVEEGSGVQEGQSLTLSAGCRCSDTTQCLPCSVTCHHLVTEYMFSVRFWGCVTVETRALHSES
jgi:hypothetical protein